MKSNGLLKWLVLPLLAASVFVGVRMCSHEEPSAAVTPGVTPNPLTPNELKSLGVGGDTTKDTLATLVSQVKQLRSEVEDAVKENNLHKAENERLRQSERNIDQRIQNALTAERDRLAKEHQRVDSDQQQTKTLVQELQRRLDNIGAKSTGVPTSDLPIGLGLDDREDSAGAGSQSLKWVEPDDQQQPSATRGAKSKKTSFGETTFKPAAESAHRALDSAADALGESGVKSVAWEQAKKERV